MSFEAFEDRCADLVSNEALEPFVKHLFSSAAGQWVRVKEVVRDAGLDFDVESDQWYVIWFPSIDASLPFVFVTFHDLEAGDGTVHALYNRRRLFESKEERRSLKRLW